jgi:hypothetical protein
MRRGTSKRERNKKEVSTKKRTGKSREEVLLLLPHILIGASSSRRLG